MLAGAGRATWQGAGAAQGSQCSHYLISVVERDASPASYRTRAAVCSTEVEGRFPGIIPEKSEQITIPMELDGAHDSTAANNGTAHALFACTVPVLEPNSGCIAERLPHLNAMRSPTAHLHPRPWSFQLSFDPSAALDEPKTAPSRPQPLKHRRHVSATAAELFTLHSK